MKKVLFTATVDSHILHFHLPYLKMFKEKGYEVHVASNTDDTIPFCDIKHKVCFERSPFKKNNLKAIKQMEKILLDNNFDIVHTHTPMGSVVTRLAYKKVRNKVNTRMIYTAHGFHFYKGAPLLNWVLFYPVEKYLSKYTDTLITINKEDYELAKKKFKKCRSVEYVPGVGIDEDKFNFTMTKSEKLELRKSLGLKENDFVLIYPARLDKNKNQGILIESMAELIKKHKDIHLLLPGEDELNGYYQKMAKEKNVDKNVHFLGYRNDIPRLLKISNVAVSTSKREGLPINIIEAMYVGLPVIATNCRGNRDLIKDGKNGYLVRVDDFASFLSKILLLYDDDAICKLFKLNSNKLISQYTILEISKSIEKIYKRKKRVLHLLASNKYSGAENVVCTIIDLLKKEYDFAYCSPNGEISISLAEKNVKFLPLKRMSVKDIGKVVEKYKPDIIHAHDYKASCYAALFYKKAKIISHIHNNCPFATAWNFKTLLYSYFISRFNVIVGVSNTILDEAVYKKMAEPKYKVLYNYVNSDAVKRRADEYRVSKTYDVFFIGRLTEQKDPLKFIEIVNDVNKIHNITAVMIGDGELMETCKEKLILYGLQERVELVGFQNNPFPYIKASKVGIMPSKWEGFGLTAIESMILNKPMLNSGCGGLGEIFKNFPEFLSYDVAKIISVLEQVDSNNIELTSKISKIIIPYVDQKNWINKITNLYGDDQSYD